MKKITEYNGGLFDFQKKRRGDSIGWTSEIGHIGSFLFSFDRQTVYNLFEDYPDNLSAEQKKIFDKENPFWKKFFGA